MQTISANLSAALITIDARIDPRRCLDVYEIYATNYTPPSTGFDPASAVEKFAGESITWNGISYRREVISRGDTSKNIGQQTNSCTVEFSNISRYLATLAQSQSLEGMFLVIRSIVPSVTDDSVVLFVGRLDKPSDIDKARFSISARQDFGNIAVTVPPDKFQAEDPEGRLPSDPLYEGIPFIAVGGSFQFGGSAGRSGLLGAIFGGLIGFFLSRKKKVAPTTVQWSSIDGTPYGQVIPECFGRVQMALVPFAWADKGLFVTYLMAACRGPIDAMTNIKSRTGGWSDPFNLPGPIPGVAHLGDLGGTGTNLGNVYQSDLGGGSKLSHLAYLEGASTGSTQDATDNPPTVTAIIRGRKVSLPNTSGVYGADGWTDNPVHITRFILTNSKWVNVDSALIDDAANYPTALHCDEPIADKTGSQLIAIPNTDLTQAGIAFQRYLQTGRYTPRHFLYYNLGDTSIVPELDDGPYAGIELGDPPPDTSDPSDPNYVSQFPLVKRYTANFPVTEELKATDLLYKIVLPTFKGFLRIGKTGKTQILSEKASDATRLRTATAVGAVSIPVLDVSPWKTGPELLKGRILLGFGLITSEVRDVTAAVYSASGNSVTLAVAKTGSVAITGSGATLTGGSTTVQASGTITIGGSPAPGDTIQVTIDGIVTGYTVGASETTGTVAAMLAAYINANQRLQKYVKAVWTSASPTVVTIVCLHGDLTVGALLFVHTTLIADPTTAPTVASSSGGSLPAGTYRLAYADTNAIGDTVLTATASITVTVNQKIDVSSLPALVGTGRDFYLSEKAGSTNLRYVTSRVNNSNFSISSVPLPGAALPPSWNTTAEELLRIAMSFATNSQDIYPVWPASTSVILNDFYLPSTPNGHRYKVTTAGTTGSSEPSWPTSAGGTVTSGSAVFTEFGSTILQQAGLTRSNVKKDSFKWPLGSRQSSVNQIKGSYRSAKDDFALIPFKVNDPVHQAQVKKVYPLEIDLSAVDNFNQMSRIANFLLSKNREGDWFVSLATGPQGMILEEGDLISVSDDSGGLVNVVCRIEDLRVHPNHDVTIGQARRYSSFMFSDDVGSHRIPIPSTLKFVQTKSSLSSFIDTIAIRDGDALQTGFKISVFHDLSVEGDWRGWKLYADYGDGYKQIAEGDVPATAGAATTTLSAVGNTIDLDTVGSLTAQFNFAQTTPFSTVTQADLEANPYLNLFLYGNEYLQAKTVVDNGGRSFTLSGLFRGRFETDTTHSASERVIFIDGAETFVPIDISRAGIAYNYKVVTTNQDLSAATAVSFTWVGNNIRPRKVSDPYFAKDASNDWLEQFTGHPRPSEIPAQYIVEHWVDETRNDTSNLKRTLPVTAGTSHAVLILAGSITG